MARGDIKRILLDNWDEFLNRFGYRVRPVVVKEVKKVLGCGSFENGYAEYTCNCCGEKKKVPFRCRSRFCSSCGKVYIDVRAENMSNKLIRSSHRHMVFTIAEELREYFMRDRKLLAILPSCAAEVIKSWWREQNKSEDYTPGLVAVIHTFGRDLKWNPHVHMLVTEGAAGEKTVWKTVKFVPYKMLRLRWQKLLIDQLEEAIGKKKFHEMKNRLYKEKSKGFYVYGKGQIKSEKAAIQYVGRYTGRPPIAESRISYDGKQVTFWYKRHEDDKEVTETVEPIEFISRLIIHIAEQQFKMIRYYGIYSQHTKDRPKLIKMVNEKIRELRNKMRKWKYRIMKSFGYDPLECQKCKGRMELTDIYYKGYGSILERYRKRIEMETNEEIKRLENMKWSVRIATKGQFEAVCV